jgi:hypothetical protein
MINRIRKIEDNEIIILNDKSFKLNNISNFYNYNDGLEAIKEVNSIKLSTIYKTVEGKRIKAISYDNYTTNFIYNKVEELNKGAYYFLAQLKKMIEEKGHKFIISDIEHDKFIDDKDDEEKDKENCKTLFNEIVNVELRTLEMNKEIYNALCGKKARNEATRKEKLLIKKYSYCQFFGLDALDEELLETFYYNKNLIYNFTNLIDKTNFKKTTEAKNIIAFEKLQFVDELLNNIGFDNIFDNKFTISGTELNNNFTHFYKNNEIYNKYKKKQAKINYNIPFINLDDNTTIKQILGHINIILNDYSIKISYKQKRNYDKFINTYYIEILNDVDEILKYKLMKGYKMNDSKNIITFTDKKKYHHLFKIDIKQLLEYKCKDDEEIKPNYIIKKAV